MKTITYQDLFEDEIAEILRNLPHNSVIERNDVYTYRPASMICEDGIYTSGKGSFTEYMYGKRTGNHVGMAYLTGVLSHTTFTVKEAV